VTTIAQKEGSEVNCWDYILDSLPVPPPPPEPTVRRAQLSRILGVAGKTISTWAATGKFPKGNRGKFSLREVREWAMQQKAKLGAAPCEASHA
jgi:hypothetical protein